MRNPSGAYSESPRSLDSDRTGAPGLIGNKLWEGISYMVRAHVKHAAGWPGGPKCCDRRSATEIGRGGPSGTEYACF